MDHRAVLQLYRPIRGCMQTVTNNPNTTVFNTISFAEF